MVNEEDWLSLTDTAIELGVRYPRARDLMTTGALGEPRKEGNGRYYIKREEIERYKREHEDELDGED